MQSSGGDGGDGGDGSAASARNLAEAVANAASASAAGADASAADAASEGGDEKALRNWCKSYGHLYYTDQVCTCMRAHACVWTCDSYYFKCRSITGMYHPYVHTSSSTPIRPSSSESCNALCFAQCCGAYL